MANFLSTQVTVTNTVDNARNVLSTNANTNTSSSNYIAGTLVVGSAAWTQVSLGSLTDVLGLTIVNDNTTYSTSVVQISGSGPGANECIGAKMTPGTQVVITWSGSISTIWAKVVGGYPTGTATPASASIQYSAQQS
jgi:hypothetical protein